ncbi:MAG: choice-of-anchor I family protein [Candidatus Eisenbacteria bacterium]|uniref:Choice-of-anchor I family protein n=1 Tax=Eiseniibacteriota bacterium TaxID=2212470 RepID=A0A956SI33_UNCEI|nr:choice-of-anchor I family protein [Candidatus Eisenbacteria bacterium]MCB9465570.1 choice-of-anchor I family protein [Candidatus Eisenbacteria bacterium]
MKFDFRSRVSSTWMAPAVLAATVQGMHAVPALADVVGLEYLTRFETGIFDDGGAEIVTYDTQTERLFFVNASANEIVALDVIGSGDLSEAFRIDITTTAGGGGANSVDAKDGLIVVAVEAETKQDPGLVAFYSALDGSFLASYPAGALPDMVTFTPDGTKVLTANEGEPSDDYTNDPEGTVTMVDISAGVENGVVTQIDLRLSFPEVLDGTIRVFGPGATPVQDMEPEYIAVSGDSETAWVTLQENNGMARIDLTRGIVTDIQPFGYKDHSVPGNGIDASDRDGAIHIANWPVFGMYMPDAIASYEVGGVTYLVTANEGDARDYGGFAEEERVKDLVLDPAAFPNAAALQADEEIGRLTVTTTQGDVDNDGDYDALYAFGARSFSIWSGDGELVWDSGEQIEQITAAAYPDDFNSTNDENDSFDNRSDNKGPEPEGVTVGMVDGRYYAFVGLERIGGVVVYDITDPNAPEFIAYENSRDFSGSASTSTDLGPEGIAFISADDSPTGTDLLAVGNEVSGTVSLYSVETAVGDPAEVGTPTNAVGGRFSVTGPNPFATSVGLTFSLSADSPVELGVFDAAGRLVRSLVSDTFAAGAHAVQWDGVDEAGNAVPAGVYYARFATDSSLSVKRIVSVR